MKVYLDTCSLQRPLDSKTQIRITLEAEVVLGILDLCETGAIEIVSSDALLFETIRNSHPTRKEYALAVLSKANTFISLNEQIEHRAREFSELGIAPLDALHLASAEISQVDYFCTCDDRFLKKAKAIHDLKIKAVSPIELAEEIEQ
jgi:predicted nucleic acid-binding protein